MRKVIIIYLSIISNSYGYDLSFLKKSELAVTDIKHLSSMYNEYKSKYKSKNELELKETLPIISTNPHHHSVQYWLRKELISKNLKGLPIIHFDSHTDMGFTPSHYLHNVAYLKSADILNELSKEKIKSFQNSLTDISQVIVPALVTKLSSEIHMCMPPWFNRINQFNSPIEMGVRKYNKNRFEKSKVHRYYPVTNLPNSFKESPFYHDKDFVSDVEMTFYNCFNNPNIKVDSDYILSLDLDIFSSNGVEHDNARPISFKRSKGMKISQEEFALFKQRLDKVLKIIKQLNLKGYKPRIITIADSTLEEGGEYTPVALAYLANLYLSSKLSQFKD